MRFRIRTGRIIGQKHLAKRKNNQDALAVGSLTIGEEEFHYGIVADGCSGGANSRNEVGAILLSRFIQSEIPLILSAGISLFNLPAALYPRCIGFFRSIAGSTVMGGPETMWNFICDHLLCTIVGFAANSKYLVTFTAGDGVLIINDQVTAIDQDNAPSYLAYQLVDRAILGDKADGLPQTFETSCYSVGEVRRFAVATDGLALEWNKKPDIIENIWSNEPEAKAGLQWWLNRESADNHRFADDCSIIAVEQIDEESVGKEE